jgi:hypothetical protein
MDLLAGDRAAIGKLGARELEGEGGGARAEEKRRQKNRKPRHAHAGLRIGWAAPGDAPARS